jgi:hypothetical protein
MGKKSGSDKQPSIAAANGQQATSSSDAMGAWKDELTEAEKALEEEKALERDKKAQEVTTAREKAKKEGVVEAEAFGTKFSFVRLEGDSYKWIDSEYYCPHCEKDLNDNTLQAHLESQTHVERIGWLNRSGSSSTAAAPAAPAVPAPQSRAAAPQPPHAAGSRNSPAWQELDGDGIPHCKVCNKVVTDEHIATDYHKVRVQWYLNSEQRKREGFEAPEEPFLAWVSEECTDGDRWLKCLLCKKWVSDDTSHALTSGSKMHMKKLGTWDWYKEDIVTEKLKWHPAPPPPMRQAPAVEEPEEVIIDV